MKPNLKLLASITFVLLLNVLACKKDDTTTTPTPTTPTTPITPTTPTITPLIPDGWKALKPFAGGGRNCAVAITIGEKIYAGLGYSAATNNGQVANDWYEYDPTTNVWTQKADFPGLPRANAIALVINGKAYVGMGTNYDRIAKADLYTDMYEFDPSTNKWTKKADFSGKPRDQPVYFTIGDKGYVGTGNIVAFDANNTKEFYEYDATKDAWNKKADLILNFTDIFNTYREKFTGQYLNIDLSTLQLRGNQAFKVRFNYRFGSSTFNRRNRNTGSTEEENRIKMN